jgi:hypothetical protein
MLHVLHVNKHQERNTKTLPLNISESQLKVSLHSPIDYVAQRKTFMFDSKHKEDLVLFVYMMRMINFMSHIMWDPAVIKIYQLWLTPLENKAFLFGVNPGFFLQ